MTNLTKPVSRVSNATIREAGRTREIVITLQPPSLLGFRAKGCRKTYWLPAAACYMQAVKADVAFQKKQKAKTHKLNKRRVSHKHWLKLEEVARLRRQATGALFQWTDVLRAAIDDYCAKRLKKD